MHAFTDGRDTSPHGSGAATSPGSPASRPSSGRYYAMDRDRQLGPRQAGVRRDRARRRRARADDAVEAVKASYAAGVTDEFIEPVVIGDPSRGPDPVRRRGGLLQLPARPSPRALVGAHPGRLHGFDRGPDPPLPALRADDGVRRRHRRSRRVPGRGPRRRSGTGARRPRRRPAPRRRDREVRPRHLLLRRRLRDPVRRRGVGAGRLAPRRPDLRQEAEHERRRGRRPRRATASPTTATGSASSTSRTPTWSATRA